MLVVVSHSIRDCCRCWSLTLCWRRSATPRLYATTTPRASASLWRSTSTWRAACRAPASAPTFWSAGAPDVEKEGGGVVWGAGLTCGFGQLEQGLQAVLATHGNGRSALGPMRCTTGYSRRPACVSHTWCPADPGGGGVGVCRRSPAPHASLTWCVLWGWGFCTHPPATLLFAPGVLLICGGGLRACAAAWCPSTRRSARTTSSTSSARAPHPSSAAPTGPPD